MECWFLVSVVIEFLKVYLIIVLGQLFLGDEVCGKISEFYGYVYYCILFVVK